MNNERLQTAFHPWSRKGTTTVLVAINLLLPSCAAPAERELDCPSLDVEVAAVPFGDGNHPTKSQVLAVEKFADQLVGRSEISAIRCAEEAGLKVRVMIRDGEASLGTGEFVISRINLEVEQGIVKGYVVG